MMLNTPRSVERNNQNALRKFPFSDSASGTNGAVVIPPGAIIDMQLYVPGRNPGRVWLSSVETDGTLRFSDENGEFAQTVLPSAPDAAVTVTFTGDGGPCPGGVVIFGRAADVAALRRLGGQSFSSEQTELAPAAVAWPGLPGITGFLLDDGHVVYGNVRIRGENGCDVATHVRTDGTRCLRISAIGKTVETVTTTGFITKVVLDSDNTSFVVKKRTDSNNLPVPNVVDILATGASTLQDDDLHADQDSLCATVRKSLGTQPNARATLPPGCESGICDDPDTTTHKIILMNGTTRVVWTEDPADSFVPAFKGVSLGTLQANQLPTPPSGKRFIGYCDATSRPLGGHLTLYYRYDGSGVGRFALDHDVTLYAHFMDATSHEEVTFENYGTLHLAEANLDVTPRFENPLRISGSEAPIPVVTEVSDSVLEKGGADALAELVLHPTVPAGEVRLGLRGLNKASAL